jgi:hypothetical protein
MVKRTLSKHSGGNSQKSLVLTQKELEMVAKKVCAARGLPPGPIAIEAITREVTQLLDVLVAIDSVIFAGQEDETN